MKILHIINSLSILGGAEVFAMNLAVNQKKRYGIETAIVSVFESSKKLNYEDFYINYLKTNGVTIYRLGRLAATGGLTYLPAIKNLNKITSEFAPDIIHSHCEVPDALNFINSFSYKKAIRIRTIQNDVYTYWKFADKLVEKIISRRFVQHFAVSMSLMKSWEKNYHLPKSKLCYIPNGVNDYFFQPYQSSYQRNSGSFVRLLMVGRLEKQKDYFKALQVVSILKNILKTPIFLDVAGEGSLRKEIEKKIVEYNLENEVKLWGALSIYEIKERHYQADIFLMTSLFEGLPLSAIEAMASGLPVIGGNIAGIRDLAKEGGILLAENNEPQEFAQQIKLLIEDKDLYLRKSQEAKNVASHYNYDTITELYVNKIKDLFNSRQG